MHSDTPLRCQLGKLHAMHRGAFVSQFAYTFIGAADCITGASLQRRSTLLEFVGWNVRLMSDGDAQYTPACCPMIG